MDRLMDCLMDPLMEHCSDPNPNLTQHNVILEEKQAGTKWKNLDHFKFKSRFVKFKIRIVKFKSRFVKSSRMG